MENLFCNPSPENLSLVFQKYGIQIDSNYQFSTFNLVIGPNGSGKTRFLKAIKELYSLEDNSKVIYGYFPSLSDSLLNASTDTTELPDYTLFESMYMPDASFSDFFKEIEVQSQSFIPELLLHHSKKQKERGQQALKAIYESFLSLTNKELIFTSDQVVVHQSEKEDQTLSMALKDLSPGELMLFYISIFLAIQQNAKKDKIIILDEPECHLHPKVLISFINTLRETGEYKQIWIATHSLFLVPELQFKNIVYIKDSQVQRRRSTIYKALFSDLLGASQDKTQLFFSSLDEWQYCEYLSECFLAPTTVENIDTNDEQVQLFMKYLKQYKPLRVLDYGGGSGRLGISVSLAEADTENKIQYEIFDINPKYKGDLFKVYTDVGLIKGPFHCIVMMNFLHEVNPAEWENIFKRVHSLLTTNGYLVFVEVKSLSVGEKPNEIGHLILNLPELELLFQAKNKLIDLKLKDNQKSICTLIHKKHLSNITADSIEKAITYLAKTSWSNIQEIHNSNSVDRSTPRQYAFFTQQYINSKIYCDKIKQIKKIDSIRNQTHLNKHLEIDYNPHDEGRIKLLRQLIRYLHLFVKQLDLNSNSILSQTILILNGLVNRYCEILKVDSEGLLSECWKNIMFLEKRQTDKTILSEMLLTLTLLGHKKSENRFINNGYIQFLPKQLASHLTIN